MQSNYLTSPLLFGDGGHFLIETSPLICSTNQQTGFYMIGTSAFKELMLLKGNIAPKLVNIRDIITTHAIKLFRHLNYLYGIFLGKRRCVFLNVQTKV